MMQAKIVSVRQIIIHISSVNDPNRTNRVYTSLGKKALPETAMVFFCSGHHTRFPTTPLPIPLMEFEGEKSSLQRLIESTPPQVRNIIISVPPKTHVFQDQLSRVNLRGRSYDDLIFVEQPLVKTNLGTDHPGGTGLVFESILHSNLWSKYAHFVFVNGNKRGFSTRSMIKFLGFHEFFKNDLSLATYIPTPDMWMSKRYGHIDMLTSTAYLGRATPHFLRTRRTHHQIDSGFGIARTDRLSMGQILPALEQKVVEGHTIRYREASFHLALNAIHSGSVGYYMIHRGELGKSVKSPIEKRRLS